MTDHNPLPRCPYCGEPMGLEYNSKSVYWYECYKCGATTPTEEAEQAAYEAAMQRWQEPNRVLTLDEVKQAESVWMEFILFDGTTRAEHRLVYNPEISDKTNSFTACAALVNRLGEMEDILLNGYNEFWRCWLRKPTAEEMATTPWREK